MATRNERDLPAYVRVAVGMTGARDIGGESEVMEESELEGFGEEGRLGRDGVLSKWAALVWLSMEDSVFERASIRLASFVGDEEGEDAGVIDSKIPDKSRVSRGAFCGDRMVSGGDGDFLDRFGEP